MTRNLKALGLALTAVLALSALGASTVQAKPRATCAEYPCVITGEAIKHGLSETMHQFVVGAKTLTCTTVKFDATVQSAEKTDK